MAESTTTVLVVYDKPEEFREALESRFPGISFNYATSPDRVEPMLQACNPHVAFSIKHLGFPGETHRPLIEYPGVEWVQVGGSGYEQFVPWDAERLTLTNSIGVLSRFLAETVTGAMLMLNGQFLSYVSQQKRAQWQPRSFTPICEQTLLVVGAGAIGGIVADNAKALGMRILGVRGSGAARPSVDEMHTPDALNRLLPEADFVSLHLRLSDQTRHLMNKDTFALMKRGAKFINTARGALVDERALIDALDSAQVGAAYLDVFETEPLPKSSPLWGKGTVFITPHAADSVPDWPSRFAEFFGDNLERWVRGETLVNIVRA